MRYRRQSTAIRTIIAKYSGKCASCGGPIKAGAMCDYDPGKRVIGHLHAFSGDGDRMQQCYSARKAMTDPGYVDVDRAYEDQCAEICGR